MTLKAIAEELQAIIDGERPRLSKTEMRDYVRELLAASEHAQKAGVAVAPAPQGQFFGKNRREKTVAFEGRGFVVVIETSNSRDYVHRIFQLVDHPRGGHAVRRKVFPAHPLGANARAVLRAIHANEAGFIPAQSVRGHKS